MDEFTDSPEMTDEQEQNTLPEETAGGQEQADSQEETSSSLPPSDQTDQEIPADLEDAEQDAELTQEPEASSVPAIDYDSLLKELQAQTEEIKAVHEVIDRQADHDQSMENICIVSVAGIGLLCGFMAALIFSNYMRH